MLKKLVSLLIVVSVLAGCSNDDNNPAVNFSTTTELDQSAFNPVNGTYYEADPESHRRIVFYMSEMTNPDTDASMQIQLLVPLSQNGFSGAYNMGIGESHEALANVYLYKDNLAYYVSSSNFLQVTSLGNHRFRFEFTDGYARLLNGTELPFSGVIEGTFDLIEVP